MFRDTRYGILIDIGSAQIDVAILSSTEGKPAPLCVYRDAFTMNLSYRMSADDRLRTVRRTLREAYKALNTDGLRALVRHKKDATLTDTLVVFRPPWSRTATRKVFFRDVTPFTISEAFLESLFVTLEEKLESEYREADIAHAFDFDIIEHAIVETCIDGCVVDEPIGTKGQEVVLRHYTGLAPAEINKDIESIQERTFPEVPVALHSCQYVSYRVLKEAYPDIPSFCIITIADEATECAVIINGSLRYATVFAIGSSTVMGQPWQDVRLGGKHTTKHIRTLASGTATEAEQEQCRTALTQYKKKLREALIEIENHLRLPRTSMVLVADEVRTVFTDICKETLKDVLGDSSTVFVPDTISMDSIDNEKIPLPLRMAGTFFHKMNDLGEGTQN